jgi:hypothetical protein
LIATGIDLTRGRLPDLVQRVARDRNAGVRSPWLVLRQLSTREIAADGRNTQSAEVNEFLGREVATVRERPVCIDVLASGHEGERD